jgi:hypothetical protein
MLTVGQGRGVPWPRLLRDRSTREKRLYVTQAGSGPTEETKRTVRPHQRRRNVFRAILAEEIDWKPFAAFPSPLRLAVVVGEPSQDGPYTIRGHVPQGVKLMPHRHPEHRVYTVISGVFYLGLGDEFDASEFGGVSARP